MIATGTQIAVWAAGREAGNGHLGSGMRWALALTVCCGLMGCSEHRERSVRCSVSQPPAMTVAVAPALNFTGSTQFDPVKVADLMASELSGISGIGVVGVNRVLAILAEQGVDRIQSPEHALQICERLGTDAILVFAITEYDAYRPIVGIAAQLYGRRQAVQILDPVATSRMARPFAVEPGGQSKRPWAEVQRVFNAAHGDVQESVKEYAESRSADQSPYGWRKYLASQERFLRFCSFTVAEDLMGQPLPQDATVRVAAGEENGT